MTTAPLPFTPDSRRRSYALALTASTADRHNLDPTQRMILVAVALNHTRTEEREEAA